MSSDKGLNLRFKFISFSFGKRLARSPSLMKDSYTERDVTFAGMNTQLLNF